MSFDKEATTHMIKAIVSNLEGKKEKKVIKKDKKKVLNIEPEPVVEDLFVTLQATALKKGIFLDADIKVGDVEEEDEEAAAIRHLEEIRAKKAQKALANQLPELVNAFVAERELELDALKVKADEINKKIADAKAGLFNEELIAKAAGKLVKPTKTKSGKKVIPLKSGEIRAEAVMGKGAMRDAKLKSLVRTKGEGIRWVSKGSKGVEYGIYKDIICSRHNGEFSMPIWADLVKELKFEKGMTIALFKQQLTTQ